MLWVIEASSHQEVFSLSLKLIYIKSIPKLAIKLNTEIILHNHKTNDEIRGNKHIQKKNAFVIDYT